MALTYNLRTFICDEDACPDFEDALTVSRGLEEADVLSVIENQFSVQFNFRVYIEEVLEAMEATRDQILRELPTDQQTEAETAMNLVIDAYAFRVLQWQGSATALVDAQERQRVWTETQRFRGEFVLVAGAIIESRAAQFDREVEEAGADSLTRLVVAFITDPAHDPIFIEGVTDPFIGTGVADQNFARDAVVVIPNFQDRGGEGSDSNLVTVAAEICVGVDCPLQPPEIENVFEYSCRQEAIGTGLESKPTLSIEWKLPKCCPVAVGQYLIFNPPPGVLTSERIEFIGGNVSYEWLLWPGRGFFITQYIQSTAACPMPGATLLLIEGRTKAGVQKAGAFAGMFSDQMSVTTIATITGDGDDRVITVAGVPGEFKPTDFFDYQVGEEVIVFGVGADLKLPLNESREVGGVKRIIPANFAGHGVTT